MKLEELIKALTQIAEHETDCLVSINGEIVSECSVRLQTPIATFGEGYGRAEKAKDPYRRRVLDISVNGREVQNLPEVRYPFAIRDSDHG